MKIPGESCPYCSLKYCTHRCDNCDEHFNWPMYLKSGIININPKSQRPYPIDDNGNIHNDCMGGGTRDRQWHSQQLRDEAREYYRLKFEREHPPPPPVITEKDLEIVKCNPVKHKYYKVIIDAISRAGKGDTWTCENCTDRGDKWYMMVHDCKKFRGLNKSLFEEVIV